MMHNMAHSTLALQSTHSTPGCTHRHLPLEGVNLGGDHILVVLQLLEVAGFQLDHGAIQLSHRLPHKHGYAQRAPGQVKNVIRQLRAVKKPRVEPGHGYCLAWLKQWEQQGKVVDDIRQLRAVIYRAGY
jgi:hypothetical protein